MKKLTYLLFIGTVFFFLGTSAALANDPPHNIDSEADCNVCHGEALFITDPGSMTPDELIDAYNDICLRCHDDDPIEYHGENAPKISSHDSATTGTGRFDFKTGCIDCHHPHYQTDQFWHGRKTFPSEWRLARGNGVLGGTETDPVTGASLTVINYTGLVPKAGSEWEADPSTLANKTGTGRGAMFLPNYNSPYNSRIIVSMTAAESSPGVWQGTIKVKGSVASISAGGFTIALGQVIKRSLPYATASGFTVEFLDHTGEKSFAHSDGLGAGGTDSTITGLCQACHTLTNHWRNTPDATRDNHFGGTNCMACHNHATGGFAAEYVDHYDSLTPYVTDYSNAGGAATESDETCISCHSSPGTFKVDRDYILNVHNSTCDNCHTQISPPIMKQGDNGNGDSRVSDGDNSCSDCHGAPAVGLGTPGAIYDIDFENAHDVKDHSGLTGRTGATIVTNCNFCHTGEIVDAITLGADIHNQNCFNCHTNTGNDGQLHAGDTVPSYNGVISVGDATNHVIGDTSNCGECHTARASDFSTHDHSDTTYHKVGGSVRTDTTVAQGAGDTSQNSTQQCSVCHNNSGSLSGWDDIYIVHNSTCNTCHNATRNTSKSGSYPDTPSKTIQDIIAANGDPTNCSACHRDKITSIAGADSIHGDHYQEGWVRGTGTTCIECHDQNNNADHTQMITTIHKNDCTNCHTNPGAGDYSLKSGSSAEGNEGATPGSPNVCTTCHTAPDPDYENDFTTHLVQDHQSTPPATDVLDGTLSNCTTSCHDTSSAANIVLNTHSNNCYNCHTNTSTDGSFSDGTGLNSKLGATSVGDATGHTIDATSTCSDCHASYAGNFSDLTNGHKVQDHNPVDETANCTTSCHLGGSALNIVFFTHSDCTNCHNNTTDNGQLRSGANGDATTHSFGNTSTCATCHADYNTDFGTLGVGHKVQDHNVVSGSSNCTTTCHINASPANIIFFTHSDCTNCHVNTGADGSLKVGDNSWGSGLPHTAGDTKECADCHGGVYGYDNDFTSHAVADHSGLTGTASVTPVSNCNGCHDGTTGPNIVTNTHNNTCTNCHTNTGADGTLKAGDNGYGTALGHSLGDTSSCAECHSARNSDFETHTHGSDVYHKTGGSVSTDTTVKQGAGDVSQENGTPCSDCHQDKSGGSTTLTTWDEIAYEHDLDGTKDGIGSCVTCHNSTRPACSDYTDTKCTQTATTIQTIIAANGDPTNCSACHIAKIDSLSTNAQHGYLPHNQVNAGGLGWVPITNDADCTICHRNSSGGQTGDYVVYDIHGGTCDTCHSSVPTIKGSSPDLRAQVTLGTTFHCTDCHKDGFDILNGYNFHDTSWADAETQSRHDKFNGSDSSLGYDCLTCHDDMGTMQLKLTKHMSSNTPSNCQICHFPNDHSGLNDEPAQTVIVNGKEHNGLDTTQNCESCHTAKGVYSMHGMEDNASAATGIGDGTGGVVFHDDIGNSVGSLTRFSVPSFTGKLSGAYGGLLVADYNCGDCHSSNPNTKAISSLEGMHFHTSTDASATGSGDCLTCHDPANELVDNMQNGFTSNGGATINCEDCHNTTATSDGNGPSGKAMYQYDGDRHHTTSHAQGGDCTWCHADPRPTFIVRTTYGYAYTADVNDSAGSGGTYDTGWVSDYSITYPVDTTTVSDSNMTGDADIPKQVGCRICHTNYGTDGAGTAHSVNVVAYEVGSCNDRTARDPLDSTGCVSANHGYNLAGYSGTATERTTGLTVYANDFNSTQSYAKDDETPEVEADRVDQATIHRIEPNDGSAMINVYDYGACLGCHSVQVMHAAPIPGTDYPVVTGNENVPWDTLRYAPGRGVFNLLRGINPNNGTDGDVSAWNQHRLEEQNGLQNLFSQGEADPRGRRYIRDNNNGTDWHFGGSLVHSTIDMPLGTFSNHENLPPNDSGNGINHEPYVAYFAEIDLVVITLAEWDGSTVTVRATTNSGTASLTADFSNASCTDGAMTDQGAYWDITCSSWTDGDTVYVSSDEGGKANAIIVDDSGPVAATAVNDTLGAADLASGPTTVLDVLANDTGTDLKVDAISSVTTVSGTCGTIAITGGGANITYTATANGNAQCTFTYDAQAYDGASPFGAADTATVTVNQAANTPPTITVNQPDGVGDTGTAGGSFTIDYDADDPDGDAISVDFYYDDNATGEDGTAIASCQNLTSKGTGLTCSWTSLPAGTWYVYGIADDGTTTTTDYSSGTVVVSATPPVTLNGAWDIVSDTTDGGSISNAYTAPAGDDRVLIVIVMTDDTGGARTVNSVTFNGSAVTEITSQSSGNNDVWIGYQALGAGSGASIADTVQATFSANAYASRIAVATYDNANQTQATNSNQTAATDNTPSITFNNAENGRAVYGVLFNNTSTITPPNGGTGWTEYDDTTVDGSGWWGTVTFRMGVGERDATTAATPVTVDPVSGGASNPSILVGASIDPL